ncbi:tetratricopeptide repeat protein [Amycolatopsis sp. NPDC051758]|uniref:tetratricopeptide repeat protein n=1 Tax=Amycolatopsis sp. NPDC051758 TaxID=3363935 RepID=UPI0037A6DBE1
MALEIAERAVRLGVLVWWVAPLDPHQLRLSMEVVARRAGIAESDVRRPDLADLLWDALADLDKPWLLVFDNIDDLQILNINRRPIREGRGWFRPLSAGSMGTVILTTRNGSLREWGSWSSFHLINTLSGKFAGEVLLDHAPHAGGQDEAIELGRRLGGLPLALRLAGAYLAETNSSVWQTESSVRTFKAYLARFASTGVMLLDHGKRVHETEDVSRGIISRTWELSFELLERRGENVARPILRLLSTFADSEIPHLLLLAFDVLKESDLLDNSDSQDLQRAVQSLVELGLVDIAANRSVPGESRPHLLRIHPLVRDASRRSADYLERRVAYLDLASALVCHAAVDAGDPTNASSWSNWSDLALHCTFIISELMSESTAQSITDAAAAAHHAAEYYAARGLLSQAELEFHAVGEKCADTFGEEARETLKSRLAEAMMRRDRSLFDGSDPAAMTAALGELERIFERHVHALGRDCSESIVAEHEFGIALAYAGHSERAREVYESAYRKSFELLGEDDAKTIHIRMSLAARLYHEGRLEEALVEFNAGLRSGSRLWGLKSPAVLEWRSWIASIYRKMGRTEESLMECRVIAKLRDELFGRNNVWTTHAKRELAAVLVDHGRHLRKKSLADKQTMSNMKRGNLMTSKQVGPVEYFSESISLFEEALSLIDQDAAPGWYGVVLHDLAEVHVDTGDVKEAIDLYRRSIESKARDHGDRREDIAITRNALAKCLILDRQFGSAVEVADTVEAVLCQADFDVSKERLAVLSFQVGKIYEDVAQFGVDGMSVKAINAYRRAVTILRREENLQSLGVVLARLGVMMREEENLVAAADYFREAIDVTRAHDANDESISGMLVDLGRVSRRLGKKELGESVTSNKHSSEEE